MHVDQSDASQNRRSRRSPVFLKAGVTVDGVPVPVTLRNLSEEGALVEGARLPSDGARTLFERNGMRIRGQVVWVAGRLAGIKFDRPMQRDELMRQVPQPKQKFEPVFRRPGLACQPLSAEDRKMLETWVAMAPVARPGD
jgi:PilZ domain